MAVLTISDSRHRKLQKDTAGPAVKLRLERAGWQVTAEEILPDERPLIAERLAALADSGRYAAIFTTGGTGVALRDLTPEATRDVIDREIPGIGEVMRAEGRRHVQTATLSRAIAGTRGKVLIVNLPGSPKGAVESLDAIVELVPHMLSLLSGRTEHAEVFPEKP
jgi:molybdenum cofactor synthesis domain-containing protein